MTELERHDAQNILRPDGLKLNDGVWLDRFEWIENGETKFEFRRQGGNPYTHFVRNADGIHFTIHYDTSEFERAMADVKRRLDNEYIAQHARTRTTDSNNFFKRGTA